MTPKPPPPDMPPAKTTAPQKSDRPGRKKQPRRISETYLHNAGLFYLQRYAASTGQFRKVMRRKIKRSRDVHGEPAEEICIEWLEQLITKFTRAGLLNDAVYAEGLVQTCRRRGMSTRALYARLQSKGLDAGQIRAALEATKGTEREQEHFAALRFARRKRLGPFRKAPLPDEAEDARFSQKELAAFARGGFSYDLSRQILEMNPEEAEERLREVR